MLTYFTVYTQIISFLGIKCNQTVNFFPFALLVYSVYSIILLRDHNFQNDVKMKNAFKMHLIKKNHSFLYQTSFILINIIIKHIVKSIIYLSFRYDTGISFMISIRYNTFDMVHIPMFNIGMWSLYAGELTKWFL